MEERKGMSRVIERERMRGVSEGEGMSGEIREDEWSEGRRGVKR